MAPPLSFSSSPLLRRGSSKILPMKYLSVAGTSALARQAATRRIAVQHSVPSLPQQQAKNYYNYTLKSSRIIITTPSSSSSSSSSSCQQYRRWNGSGRRVHPPPLPGSSSPPFPPPSAAKSSTTSPNSIISPPLNFLQRFLGPKPMPPKNTSRWYAEMALICTVFGITGTSTMFLVRPAVSNVLGLKGSLKDGPWSYRICSIVIMTPIYATLLVIVGTVFGRHAYFRHFSVKMFSRFGIPPELMDKNYHANAKNFKKW